MAEVYVFRDWTAVSQIKNSITSKRRVFSSICPCNKSITLTIVEDNVVLVRVPVDSDTVWSLSSEDAVNLLNSYGFNCRYENTYQITRTNVRILRDLKDFGMTFITRLISPGDVVAFTFKETKSVSLKGTKDWNYNDWLFLTPNVDYSIDSLLKEGECCK